MKKILITIIFVTLIINTSCKNIISNGENYMEINFRDIMYEKSNATFDAGSDLVFNLIENYQPSKIDLKTYWNYKNNPVANSPGIIGTGEKFKLNLINKSIFDNYGYCIVDWGDGTWSYRGPYKNNVPIEIEHKYYRAGMYDIKAAYYTINDGRTKGWTQIQQIQVNGNIIDKKYINRVKVISSSEKGEDYLKENITDGNNHTDWISKNAEDIYSDEWVGYLFDDFYTIDQIEVKTSFQSNEWPQNISLEYTVDGGDIWYSLPQYYFNYKYSNERYKSFMGFPNPKGATLQFDLNGIVANGVRIVAKMFPLNTDVNKREFVVSEFRVTEGEEKLFFTSKGGEFDALLNNMWSVFGSAVNEPLTNGIIYPNADPFRSGISTITSTEWLDWDGRKLIWGEMKKPLELYSEILQETKVDIDSQGDFGFVWATIHSQKHLGEQSHYSNNPIFIIAVRNYLLQLNHNKDFLEEKNSHGQTIYERVVYAMEYMLENQKGREGLLIIKDPENDGTRSGKSSNYWDYYNCFGYKSAYENTLFYQSLLAMADIELFLGNKNKFDEYIKLSEKVKEQFNQYFWNEKVGRYIGSIDVDGNKHDFGFTFINLYAIYYRLASDVQAKLIFEWLDGKRIIESDTSRGEDIYGAFKYSPRSNTLDMYTAGEPFPVWSHGGVLNPIPGTLGGYGNQMQNGGTIFYVSHYDVISRINKLGADNAKERFDVIIDEFKNDELRRFGYSNAGGYVEGVIGEFPESGLVPLVFLEGFLGITTGINGLQINPKLPKEWKYAGINSYRYNNNNFSIRIERGLKKPVIVKINNKFHVRVPSVGNWIISEENKIIEHK